MFRGRNKQLKPSIATPKPKDEVKKSTISKIALRNACAIGAFSVTSQLASANCPSKIVGLSRQMIELRKWTLQTEVEILELLRSMDDFDRLETLFEMFDKDDSGEVTLSELETALNKIDFHQALHDSIFDALKNFDSCNGQMEFKEFSIFIDDFRTSVGWTFEEVTEFLAIHVGFANGAQLLDEGVDMLLGSSMTSLSNDFHMAVMEVRMIYLFQMFDPLGNGSVDFEDVAKSLLGLTSDMDQVTREVLMMCSAGRRKFSYDRFSQVIYDVVAAGGYDFDSIANGMTLTSCKKESSKNDLGQLFHGMVFEASSSALVTDCNESKECGGFDDDPVITGKVDRLFDMWDMDRSGKLDLEEIMMGLGKFNQTKDVEFTLEDTMQAIQSFDDNGDAKLDRVEFRHMLTLFAAKTKIPLQELVDFMVVTSALKDNDEGMLAYITSVKARATNQLKRAQSMKRLMNLKSLSVRKLWK